MGTRNTKRKASAKSAKKTKGLRAKTTSGKKTSKVMFIYARGGNADYVKSVAKKSNTTISAVMNTLIAALKNGSKAKITDISKKAA